jgi:hypothetical protein
MGNDTGTQLVSVPKLRSWDAEFDESDHANKLLPDPQDYTVDCLQCSRPPHSLQWPTPGVTGSPHRNRLPGRPYQCGQVQDPATQLGLILNAVPGSIAADDEAMYRPDRRFRWL